MTKAKFGQCIKCEPGVIRLLVVKKLCKYHNEQKKNAGKPPRVIKPRLVKKKTPKHGQCKQCPDGETKLLQTKHLCKFHNDLNKREAKSKRVVKLIDKAEKKKSVRQLKIELDAIFSLYIRNSGAKDGMNQCFTCNATLPIKELQDGHYESRKFLSLRYEPSNNHPQCYICNIVKNGNYTEYALRMIEKYGKEHLDMLSIKKHNVVKWGRFEYELMIAEYTKKLNDLIKSYD